MFLACTGIANFVEILLKPCVGNFLTVIAKNPTVNDKLCSRIANSVSIMSFYVWREQKKMLEQRNPHTVHVYTKPKTGGIVREARDLL